mmetsp:Transcript_5769/g.17138  ORF Transcript_5769/g.17138 Transcript_5769/m.17138 type:complete len:203 (+) Transcript_5769:2535-3143(+)
MDTIMTYFFVFDDMVVVVLCLLLFADVVVAAVRRRSGRDAISVLGALRLVRGIRFGAGGLVPVLAALVVGAAAVSAAVLAAATHQVPTAFPLSAAAAPVRRLQRVVGFPHCLLAVAFAAVVTIAIVGKEGIRRPRHRTYAIKGVRIDFVLLLLEAVEVVEVAASEPTPVCVLVIIAAASFAPARHRNVRMLWHVVAHACRYV